jgi:protein involved in polysaccharide export with SLBB domain
MLMRQAVSNKGTDSSSEESTRSQEKIINNKIKDSPNSLVFLARAFDNPTLNFQPNLKLATPMNYILGPGDELQVSLNGVQEYNASILSVEGKVSIQFVGQIYVSELVLRRQCKIKAAMAKVYSTIGSGQSQVTVSLSRIRTIRVTIIGKTTWELLHIVIGNSL